MPPARPIRRGRRSRRAPRCSRGARPAISGPSPTRTSACARSGSLPLRDLEITHAQIVEPLAQDALFLAAQVALRLLLKEAQELDVLARQEQVRLFGATLDGPTLRVGRVAEVDE